MPAARCQALSGGQVPGSGSKISIFARKITKSLEHIALFLIFAPELLYETIMCTVNIKVNEAVLRDVLPELDSKAAINRWAQLLIDQHIDALTKEHALQQADDDMIKRECALNRDMTPDELYDIIAEEIDSIYAAG